MTLFKKKKTNQNKKQKRQLINKRKIVQPKNECTLGLVTKSKRGSLSFIGVHQKKPLYIHKSSFINPEINHIYEASTSQNSAKLQKDLGNYQTDFSTFQRAAIFLQKLPNVWSESVMHEIEQYKSYKDPYVSKRRNLTHLPFITIDGEDAQDFDDAVYAEKTQNYYILYVSIADVASFVLSHSALDKEALLRSNSVYFTNAVIPMLPPILSNQLCSLVPREVRQTITAKIIISKQGEILHYSLFPSIIKSKLRATYTQVENFINPVKKSANSSDTNTILQNTIPNLYDVYNALRTHAKKRGAIHLDVPEYNIHIANNRIDSIQQNISLTSHKIIEQCMIAANQAVAHTLLKKGKGIFRSHPEPEQEKIEQLIEKLTQNGIRNKNKKNVHKLLNILQKYYSQNQQITDYLILRSQSQANYSLHETSHFALALDHYTHFTSPIRRYADLIVHRYLHNVWGDKQQQLPTNNLPDVIEHLNTCERNAMIATRIEQDFLTTVSLKNMIDKVFTGYLSGVVASGIFVNIHLPLDVFIPNSLLPNEWYEFNVTHNYILKRDETMNLGHPLKIKLTEISVIKRRLNGCIV